jgi:hypothetical protein
MRKIFAFALLALALVPVAAGSELTIYPGVGIGKLKLGMTKSQVRHVLGRDALVNAREGAYTEYAWDFATWTVGFEQGHAVQIATTLASQRTTKRIGPGSTWPRVVRAYPGGRCAWNARPNFNSPAAEWPEYLVGHRGGTQTLFVFKPQTNNEPSVLNEVVVRTRFHPLSEFAASWPATCRGEWKHDAVPQIQLRHG